MAHRDSHLQVAGIRAVQSYDLFEHPCEVRFIDCGLRLGLQLTKNVFWLCLRLCGMCRFHIYFLCMIDLGIEANRLAGMIEAVGLNTKDARFALAMRKAPTELTAGALGMFADQIEVQST